MLRTVQKSVTALSLGSHGQILTCLEILSLFLLLKVVDEEEDLGEIDRLTEHFRLPLEKAGMIINEIHAEFECLLQYATSYIALSTLDYTAVWWRLFHSPDSASWVNVLNLIELLFSLPVSNGVVERVFSQMNVIKAKKRSSIQRNSE